MLAPNPFDLMAQPPDRSKNNSRTVSAARSPKKIPDKCVRCALLLMAEVRSLHGATGDGCYVSEVCRSRRSYARHHHQRNQTRKQKWHETKVGVDANPVETQVTAQLIVYREPRYNAPIDGIAAIVRHGKTKLAVVQPVYCAGLLPKQIYACIEAMLVNLEQKYSITKFAGVMHQLPRSWQEPERLKQRSLRYPEIQVDLPGVTDCYSAVLKVYRPPEMAAVMAIKTEVWRGSTPESGTPLLDCRGLLPSQIHAYLGQVLALLELRYQIRWFARQVQLPLESCLPLLLDSEPMIEEEQEPEITLDLDPLWRELETSLQQSNLLPVQALEVASEGISQVVLQFTQFADLTFEELEAVVERGVMLPSDAFDRYVRQTMEVDFEQFIEPLATLPRKHSERQEIAEGDSVVGELDQAAVLQVLDEQMSQEPELTEVEIFNQALALAHDEDVSAWAEAIARWMREYQVSTIPLIQLQQSMGIPLIQLWLTLLLGDQFVFEQRGSFYDLSGVWISIPQ
ncbi:hypothetical protein AB3R30_24365 [Leptolyngbyaceae cyanobacterium UHCC 1019]